MSDSERIRLLSVERDDSGGKISFAFLKKDYVAKSLVIYLDGSGIIEKIFFSSNTYGTVEWENGRGLVNCHMWESEDQAREPTYLTKRYTSILSDGAVDAGYAKENILPDVLDYLEDGEIAEWIEDIISVREYLVAVDLSRFGN